jgi:uncharacterized membrane protein YqjE
MRLGLIVIVGLCLLLTPIALICLGILLKLGLEESYRIYGAGFTIGLVIGIAPCLVALAFLLDRREQQNQNPPTDSQFDGQ